MLLLALGQISVAYKAFILVCYIISKAYKIEALYLSTLIDIGTFLTDLLPFVVLI